MSVAQALTRTNMRTMHSRPPVGHTYTLAQGQGFSCSDTPQGMFFCNALTSAAELTHSLYLTPLPKTIARTEAKQHYHAWHCIKNTFEQELKCVLHGCF